MPTKKIIINQKPQAQGRPRFARRGNFVVAYDPHKDQKAYAKLLVADQVAEKLTEPLIVSIVAYMPIPKSTSNKKRQEMISGEIKHVKRPDVDNLGKMILDVMNDVVFMDDSQIWKLLIIKQYSEDPRTEIVIEW